MGETRLWKALEIELQKIFRLINGKQVILWGYGQSGCFMDHFFKKKNRSIDYIIDDYLTYPSRFRIYKSSILQELDNRNCFIICAFPESDESRNILEKHGYVERISYINLNKELFGNENRKVSYYDWLEYYYGVDIVASEHVEKGDNLFYSYGSDYALMDVLDDFCFNKEDGIFDFGCGKGGPMIMFCDRGVGRVGGVEYNQNLYNIANDNLRKCGITNYELLNDNALNIQEKLDYYNFFYMYNSFVGDTFRGVIKNLEESFRRNKRQMVLLYSGVTHHADVVQNGYFRLTKRINNDYWNKYTNVYLISG